MSSCFSLLASPLLAVARLIEISLTLQFFFEFFPALHRQFTLPLHLYFSQGLFEAFFQACLWCRFLCSLLCRCVQAFRLDWFSSEISVFADEIHELLGSTIIPEGTEERCSSLVAHVDGSCFVSSAKIGVLLEKAKQEEGGPCGVALYYYVCLLQTGCYLTSTFCPLTM